MAKSFHDQHPPRVDWTRLRQGPTPADLDAVPPASPEEWATDGTLVSPLPDDIAQELKRRTAAPHRKSTHR